MRVDAKKKNTNAAPRRQQQRALLTTRTQQLLFALVAMASVRNNGAVLPYYQVDAAALISSVTNRERGARVPAPPTAKRRRQQQRQQHFRTRNTELSAASTTRRTFLSRGVVAPAAVVVGAGSVVSVVPGSSPRFVVANAADDADVASTSDKLAARLADDVLQQPPASVLATSSGTDNTYYPDFMAGSWSTTQTLTRFETPLGLKFVGGPSGNLDVAEKSAAEQRSRVGQPVNLELRYLQTKFSVAEDRLFNSAQRLNAFAGRAVVATADYADVRASNRASVVKQGGTDRDPLQTVVVRFKGPAAIKTFVTGHGSSGSRDDDANWIGYEMQRSIFALTNESTAPPVTTDTELIWKFTKLDDDHVRGRLRIAGYLNPQSDKLYFEAKNRAVTIQDYDLDMRRKKD